MKMLISTAATLVVGLQLLMHAFRGLADTGSVCPRWLAVTKALALDAALVLVVVLWLLVPLSP